MGVGPMCGAQLVGHRQRAGSVPASGEAWLWRLSAGIDLVCVARRWEESAGTALFTSQNILQNFLYFLSH